MASRFDVLKRTINFPLFHAISRKTEGFQIPQNIRILNPVKQKGYICLNAIFARFQYTSISSKFISDKDFPSLLIASSIH